MPQSIDNLIEWIAFYTGYLPTQPRPAGDHKYHACCPFHHEDNPSFWFNTTNGLWKCEAGCGSGNATSFLARVKGVDTRSAWEELCRLAGVDPAEAAPAKPPKKPRVRLPHSLAEYGEQKKLPEDYLRRLGLADAADSYGLKHVTIPYFDEKGACCAMKRRYNPQNTQRFGWADGARIIPYGVWLDLNKKAKAMVLCEGESDAQSLWLHGIPALGIPCASNYQAPWTAHYIGDRDVYLHLEPGKSGDTFRKKTLQALWESDFKGRVFAFACADTEPACKDPSDLHILRGGDFGALIGKLIKAAKSISLSDECMSVHQAVDQAKPQKTKKLQTYKASELYGKTIERPPVIVQGIIPAGLTVLAGAPKRGKSWLALKLALDVAAGNPFLGHETT